MHRINKKNNGIIGVISKEGEGSNFWITLPQGKKVEPSVTSANNNAAGLRVLVVEDNPIHQQTSENALKELQFSCEIVSNGQEALDHLDKEPVDLC